MTRIMADDREYLSAYFEGEWEQWARRLRDLVDADTSISDHVRLAVVVYVAVRDAYANHPEAQTPDSPKAWHLTITQIVDDALAKPAENDG